MADFLTPQKRSALMSRIRSRGNVATELRFIQVTKSAKISGWRRGFRLHGKPDFVFPKLKLAVFIDGCFWHGCEQCCKSPKTNMGFWLEKFARNKKRDRAVGRVLQNRGWKVLRIWQHELTRKNVPKLLKRLNKMIK